MNKIKFMIIAFVAILSLASCSEEEAPKMMWEVSATPAENVKVVFDPRCYYQIQVAANGEAGEVILKCTNYKTLKIDGIITSEGEWINAECNFDINTSDSGVIKLILDKMPDGFTESTVYLHVNGTDGKHTNVNIIEVTRRP